MAAVAGQLLSALFTSCSIERNWSLFTSICSKTKANRLALDQAKKLSYIRSKNDSRGTRPDEDVALSLADVLIEDEQEAEEKREEKEGVLAMCKQVI